MKKGFTLLEILLVIAAIGILAAIVIVAINPNRQLAQARNAERQASSTTLADALNQYLIDNGSYPSSVTQNFQEICASSGGSGCLDITGELVPDYISAVPIDPNASGDGSGYLVRENDTNTRISVYAVNSELNQEISVNHQSWTPERITTRLWYDFSDESTITLNGSNISGVTDKSDSGINLSQSTAAYQPQYYTAGINGRNTFYVQDTDRVLSLVTPLAFNYTIENIFVVLKVPVVSDYNIVVHRNSPNVALTPAPYAGGNSNNFMTVFWSGNLYSSYTISNETGIFQWGYNNTNGTTVTNKNGGTPYVGSGYSSIASNSVWTNIGGVPGFPSQAPDLFHYGEIIFVADVTTDIRQRIEGYLAHKWGLAEELPGSHPYRSIADFLSI